MRENKPKDTIDLINSKIKELETFVKEIRLSIPSSVDNAISRKQSAEVAFRHLNGLKQGLVENKEVIEQRIQELKDLGEKERAAQFERKLKQFENPEEIVRKIFERTAKDNAWMEKLDAEKKKQLLKIRRRKH